MAPKANHHETMTRQWEILQFLPRGKGGKTAAEVVRHLEEQGITISKRTVERDLIALSVSFGLVCDDESVPYQWQWMPGSGAEFPTLTIAEALSIKIVESVLRPLLPKSMLETLEHRFREAGGKLSVVPRQNQNSDWSNKFRYVQPALPLLPPGIDEDVLACVQTSLLKDRQLEIRYQALGQKEPQWLTMHPLALVQRGPTTYLVATAYEYRDIRLYAVHRISEARTTTNATARPYGFSVDEYIAAGGMNFSAGRTIRLKANIESGLCRLLEETPVSDDQSITVKGGKAVLTATVSDSWQLKWWILSQGNGIEIVKPVSLRKAIAESLQQALGQYNPDASGRNN